MSFSPGSLVKARGREWVVLPESSNDLVMVRPLGGTDDEITGICTTIETVESASFMLPDPTDLGDYRSCRLLRDAVRLGFRSGAGPFRSFGQIAIEPRPYQLVPLLLALRLDPIRILIADDVGIGKTAEACLIARELLDRGEVHRLAVLCPPQIAEQWQSELNRYFHIDAELVLPSTASRLERHCPVGHSLFEIYPHVIVSLDFIKTDRRCDEFLRACPEMVIVDEAHTCASGEGTRSRHQRYRLVSGLAQNPDRHMILVTATPHSGKDEVFRSLLSLLDPKFAELPEDLSGEHNRPLREHLARHFVQRRRADIRHFMSADTPFPERLQAEETYKLSLEYAHLFDRVLSYAKETVEDPTTKTHQQRVRWWSALALLRSLASSPAAAAATLRSRAGVADTERAEDADEVGRRAVFDLADDDALEGGDVPPGSDVWDETVDEGARNRRRQLDMAREADTLIGARDNKLLKATELVKKLILDGFRPILFCRFIPTAEYVAQELQSRLRRDFSDIEVEAVTGTLPPEDREDRVLRLSKSKHRVLVCTDCLSEGINLQDHFDAVFHYDLPWNPTRLEQREGRVDRFGQVRKEVRAVTYYGIDNQIDGVVLDILLKKHQSIRKTLGIIVPVPVNTEQLVEALFEGLVLREKSRRISAQLRFEEWFSNEKSSLFTKWDAASEREKRSRTLFAQQTIKVDEVAQELRAAQEAVGLGVDVQGFVKYALEANGAAISGDGKLKIDLTECPRALRDVLPVTDKVVARFVSPVEEEELLLTRTHPFVERLASYTMDTALDPLMQGVARRCGVIRTVAVSQRTTLLVTRNRYHIHKSTALETRTLLAEECCVLAFKGAPDSPNWLSMDAAETIIKSVPSGNVPVDLAGDFVKKVIQGIDNLTSHLEEVAEARAKELLQAHTRVRRAARLRGINYTVEPHFPLDILGIYVYLPSI
jgi:superfamily II DNA or RNA helicase